MLTQEKQYNSVKQIPSQETLAMENYKLKQEIERLENLV